MGPLSFVAAFTVLNAPWKLYKSLYLGNRIIMFQEHFLYGYGNGKDLWASIRLFLEAVPLFAQLPLRISTLVETMGYGIPQGLIGRFDIHYLGVLDIWNKLEFVRFPYLIAIPVSMTVLTLGWLLVRRQSLRVWYGQSIAHGAEVLTFLCCGYLSLTLLSFVYFSTHKVWSTTYQPSGLITLVFFLLVGIAWQGPPWVKGVFAIVGGFSLLRFLTFLL